MVERDVLLGGERLRPVADATTVRVRDGEVLVSDGPFAETKELVAGFAIVECTDLDEALEVAAKHPYAATGTIEVRPVWEPWTGRPGQRRPGSREPGRSGRGRRRSGGGRGLPPRVGPGGGDAHRRHGRLGPGRGVRTGGVRPGVAGVAAARGAELAGRLADDRRPQRRHRPAAAPAGRGRQAPGRGRPGPAPPRRGGRRPCGRPAATLDAQSTRPPAGSPTTACA